MLNISIPSPCNANWEDMPATSKGGFCQLCAKEVIDFTRMTDDAVKHYLLSRRNEKLCGRFRQDQLDRIKIYLPANILKSRIANWKKWIAIILLAFGITLTGCDVIMNRPTTGEPLIKQAAHKLTGDTVYITTGAIIPPIKDDKSDSSRCNDVMGKSMFTELEVKGDVSIIVNDSDVVFTGGINIDTTINAMDSVPANKNPADSADCGNQNFY